MKTRDAFWLFSLALFAFGCLGDGTDDSTTPTPTPTPTPQCNVPTVQSCSPSPSYVLLRGFDCIETTLPQHTGEAYAMDALLCGPDGSFAANQSDFSYSWSIDDPTLATLEPFTGCVKGIQAPCPYDHLSVVGQKLGSSTVRVSVTQISHDEVVASTSIPLTYVTPTPTPAPTP